MFDCHMAAAQRVQTEAALAAMTAEAYRTAFDRFDTDRSGTIDARELRGALRKLGLDKDVAATLMSDLNRAGVKARRAPFASFGQNTRFQ